MPLSPLLPGFASPGPGETLQAQIDALDTRVDALEGAGSASGYRASVLAYGAVANGSPTSWSTTDNYTAFANAIAFCKANPGYDLFVPPGQYDIYFDTDIADTAAGKHRFLAIDFANLRIVGTGIGKSIIRGKSSHVLRGRVGSLVGNDLTLATASDAGAIRANWSCRITANADGTGARAIGAGAISVLGPVCSSAAGNGTTGIVPLYEGTRFSGVVAGDYVFFDVGFALFQHEYTPTALTTPFNLTIQDLELHAEQNSAVVDPTGDANPILDAPTYLLNSNPQPMTSGTSPYHKVLVERVRGVGGYTQFHFGGGGANTKATTELSLVDCDMGTDAMMAVFMSTNDTFRDRIYSASHCYFHGLQATMASHLNYINPAVSLKIDYCHYDGWRASNFALQHWGSTSVANKFAVFSHCHFGAGGGGQAVLTGEHGSCLFDTCTFECYSGVHVRCSTTFDSCFFKPPAAYPNGTGIDTYLDCQHHAQITIKGCGWNLANIVGTGYTACVNVEHPCQVTITDCWATSIDEQQSSSNTLVRGNTGPFLLVKDGSTGGLVTVDGLRGKFATQSGAVVNVGWLASLVGTSGAAVKFKNVRWLSRPASDRGQIQTQGRTSTDRIEIVDCNITAAAGAVIYTTTLPADVISGRGNRFNGMGSTFVNRQRLRGGGGETGPDIASGTTIVWDPDYDYARITGTTDIATINVTADPVPTPSQIGYHGMVITLNSVSGWATTTAGNIFAAYTVAAGADLVLRYDAVASKWIRVGS